MVILVTGKKNAVKTTYITKLAQELVEAGEKVFVLTFLQARDPIWVGRPFFAQYSPRASWLTDLKPAFGEPEFFYSKDFRRMLKIDDDSLSIFSEELPNLFSPEYRTRNEDI